MGLIAISFGIGARYATGELGVFGGINLAVGGASLLLSFGLALRNFHGFGASAARAVLLRRVGILLITILCAVSLERGMARLAWQWDWTVDQRFHLAPATNKLLEELPNYSYMGKLQFTLFTHPSDPRVRTTRLLLETLRQKSLEEGGNLQIRELLMDNASEEIERFEVSNSNSVGIEWGGYETTVQRPNEGNLLEAIQLLIPRERRVLYVALGEGEGTPRSDKPTGYSALWGALEAEGYELRGFATASFAEIPADARAVLLLGPRRNFEAHSLTALENYLAQGGRLLALLEPGTETGLEEFLLRVAGFQSPSDRIVIDPLAAALEGQPKGLAPLINAYGDHPITAGLSARTMTLFASARPVYALRLPVQGDRLFPLAYSSADSYLSKNIQSARRGRLPEADTEEPPERQVLAAAGEYKRDGKKSRVVVFGDSDFASNRFIRSLYNVDLIVNAVHWVSEREAEITLRPKRINPYQEPLTPQDSLRLFYTIGLLLPELLLVAAAIAWTKSRNA
jgi:hypothetical protein